MADTKIKPLSAGKRAKLEKKRGKLEKKLREIEVQLSAPPKVQKARKPGKKAGKKRGLTKASTPVKAGRKPKKADAGSLAGS